MGVTLGLVLGVSSKNESTPEAYNTVSAPSHHQIGWPFWYEDNIKMPYFPGSLGSLKISILWDNKS